MDQDRSPIIAGAFTFVAGYKGLKEGAAELVKDARSFSELFNSTAIDDAQASGRQVFRTERRTKTPGKLLRATRRYEWLEEHRRDLKWRDAAREREDIATLLKEVMSDSSHEDQEL